MFQFLMIHLLTSLKNSLLVMSVLVLLSLLYVSLKQPGWRLGDCRPAFTRQVSPTGLLKVCILFCSEDQIWVPGFQLQKAVSQATWTWKNESAGFSHRKRL